MVTISKSSTGTGRRYGNTQLRYSMVHVSIMFVVLLFLNIYCSSTIQQLIYQGKQSTMTEKVQLAAAEITEQEVINASTVSSAISQTQSLWGSRLIVTDHSGRILYDSGNIHNLNNYALFPEIVTALQGNDVFTWNYSSGVMESRAACPMISYGTLIGCVYMMELDTTQGALIDSLQRNILAITAVLNLFVLVLSLAFAQVFSKRLRRIMSSIRIIREGDYSHKVFMGGNDELTFLGNEFNDLTDRLQDSQKTQRQFVSDASHELKTPLASIKLLTDSILQNDMDGDTIREFVTDIGNEADRLTRMSEKLLSLTRLDSEYSGNCEIVYMAPTVQRVARMLRGIARKNAIEIRLELDDDCPILILEDDLYQITFNLVENGIKYNLPNGQLTVSLHRVGDNAVLQVTDTGMGIPLDAQQRIFERFYRVDKARSRQAGGSGLGLAIVRDMVRRNRGEISVDSVPGRGTTFRVTFPAFDIDEETQ